MPAEVMVGELNSSTDTDGIQRIYGIDVPLGIIRIDHATEKESTNFTLIVELAEGNYKGIKAESMVDAKSQTWASPTKGGRTTKRLN